MSDSVAIVDQKCLTFRPGPRQRISITSAGSNSIARKPLKADQLSLLASGSPSKRLESIVRCHHLAPKKKRGLGHPEKVLKALKVLPAP